MRATTERRPLDERTQAEIRKALSRVGVQGKWTKSPSHVGAASWVVTTAAGEKIAIAAKSLQPMRYANLEAQVALGLIQLHHARRQEPGCMPLLVLVVPDINERLKAEFYVILEAHSELLAPDWLLLSETGRYYAMIGGKSAIGQLSEPKANASRSFLDHYVEAFSKHPSKQRISAVTFTGNHQWILKYLLLNGIESKYWGASTFTGQWNSNTLKVQAGYNTAAQTHNVLVELEEAGYLVRTRGRIVFRDLRRLFESWIQAYHTQKHVLMPLGPLYPGEDFDQWRDKKGGWWARFEQAAGKANVPILVGGHMGCFALGVGWSNNPSILLHATIAHPPSLELFLRAMELKETDNTNSPIQLQLHRFQKPVLDVVELEEKPQNRTVDIIQCILDVSLFGGRGEEQAEHIFEKILFPHFRRMEWSL